MHHSTSSQHRRRRRVAPVVAGLLIIPLAALPPTPHADAFTSYRIFGTISCPSTKPPVGVFIESSGGGGRFADWKILPGSPTVAYFSTTISTTLPTNVKLSVGCGGTKTTWASTNKTPAIKIATGGSRALNTWCDAKGICSWAPTITTATDTKTVNPVGVAYKCQCTYYAAERWKDAIGVYPNWRLPDGSGRIGNANTWDDNAERIGWRVTNGPRPRSLFVENAGGGGAGHVGYVQDIRINSNGTIDIQVSDQNADGIDATCDIQTDHWLHVTTTMRFIVLPPKSG